MSLTRRAKTSNLLSLTLSLFLFAGCVGGDAAPEAAPPAAAGDAAPVFDEKGNALARYALEDNVSTTLWFNGTYTVQDHYFPAHWLLQPTPLAAAPGMRMHDIGDEVPRGLPVQITAELNAATTDGDVEMWIQAPWEEAWAGTWDTPPGGQKRIEMRIQHVNNEPIQVGLFYDEIDRSQSFDYTLRVDIEANPSFLVGGVGASLQVPIDGATLLVDLPAAGTNAALLVWDDSQEYMGRFPLAEGTTRVPLESAGEHLLLLAEGSGLATVALENVTEPVELGPAKQELDVFEGETTTSPVTWSFDADRQPIQIGYMVMSGTIGSDFAGTLAGPDGPLLESEFAGGPWVRPLMGFGIGDWTSMGDGRLVPGTYTVEASFGQTGGPDPIRYGHTVVYLAPV